MRHWRIGLILVLSVLSQAQNTDKAILEKGTLTIHLLLHPIGEESYEVVQGPDRSLVMNTAFQFSDRGRRRTVSATLQMKPDFTPTALDVKTTNASSQPSVNSVAIHDGIATVREEENSREINLPPSYFVGF